MPSAQLDAIVEGFRRLYAGWTRDTGIGEMRAQWDAFLARDLIAAGTRDVMAGGVPCRWVRALGADEERIIVFLHGGGYQIGSLASHHNAMARLSEAAGCSVLGVDYRLAPEHRCPAALDDAAAAYRWVLDQGHDPQRIALCGDSAGGGLAVAVMALARDEKLALPAAAAVMSPWVDMEALGASYEANQALDPVTQRAAILLMAKTYVGRGGDPRDPRCSPIYADLAGLPPLLVQVGEREVLLDDARTLAQRAQAAGVHAELQVWPGMIHIFQLFAGRLDEADAAIAQAAQFLNRYLKP